MNIEEEFKKLKTAIIDKNVIEKYKCFGNILENMTNYFFANKDKNIEVSFLSEAIKRQKVLFEASERLYEGMENEDGGIVEEVEKLRVGFGEYVAFVESR